MPTTGSGSPRPCLGAWLSPGASAWSSRSMPTMATTTKRTTTKGTITRRLSAVDRRGLVPRRLIGQRSSNSNASITFWRWRLPKTRTMSCVMISRSWEVRNASPPPALAIS